MINRIIDEIDTFNEMNTIERKALKMVQTMSLLTLDNICTFILKKLDIMTLKHP